MLKKLMKHELRATSRTMLPMLLFVLAAAVGGNLSVNRLLESASKPMNAIGVFLLILFVVAIMSSCIMAFVLMIERFYKNLLRDEGYLMMTLPVSVHQHILSKLLVSLIWFFAVAAASCISLVILAFRVDLVKEVFLLLSSLRLHDMTLTANPVHVAAFLLEVALMLTAIMAYVCLLLYAAMSIGHSFTHRKGLLTIIAFFALGMTYSLLENVSLILVGSISLGGFRNWFDSLPTLVQLHLAPLGITGLILIPCALYYAVTAYFLKNRLNLA